MFLEVVDTGIAQAQENMAWDAAALDHLDPEGSPILHFYDWKAPSITYGYFIDVPKQLSLQAVEEAEISLARRPTGGGIVFHLWDLAFSFLLPAGHKAFAMATLANYRFVNQIVLQTVLSLFSLNKSPSLIEDNSPLLGPNCGQFCMARPTQFDVVHEGKKIAGAAQRRTKNGYLHQGTISLAFPDLPLLRRLLTSQEEVAQAMQTFAFAPLGRATGEELAQARSDLKRELAKNFVGKLSELGL